MLQVSDNHAGETDGLPPKPRDAVTLAAVAARAGVSVATASRVLNGNTRVLPGNRDLVMKAARELNYHVDARARGLVLRRTRTIGVVFSNVGDPYFAEILLGAEEAATAAGYHILVSVARADPRKERDALTLLREHRVDGAILVDSHQRVHGERTLALSGFAVVLLDPHQPGACLSSIGTDHEHSGRLAAEHLLGLGHRKLAYLGGLDVEPNKRRRSGLLATAARFGLAPRDIRLLAGDGTFDGSFQVAEEFLRSRPDVTGLICYDDVTAIGALRACRHLGYRVPEDISLVGFDDIVLAQYVDPPLTTVRQPKEELGARAIEMVIDLLNGGAPKHVQLQGVLVERASTAAPRR